MGSVGFEEIRRSFPGALEAPYLNVASRGILSSEAVAAVQALLAEHQGGGARKEDWKALGERTRGRFATLIGARPEEIAFTTNTGHGLNIVASGLPWQDGDNVVLCPALEHPNNIYAWLNLRSHGVEVRPVAAKDNAFDDEAMLAAIDGRTRVVAVALVSFTPGYRTILTRLAEACRQRGAMLVVDAVQACGAVQTDVEALGIDALATATTKGLLGLYGFGFLYVRQSWIDRLEPAHLARFSVDQGDAHESEMGSLEYRLLPDARRFEVGHYNWPGVAAADASLAQILAVGPARIEEHALRLAARLRDGLASLDLPVCVAPKGAETHIVTVGAMGGGAYDTEDPRLNALARHLAARGVQFSVRRGLLRFATHMYNNDEDIDRVLALAAETAVAAAAE